MRLKHILGPSIPMSEARVWRMAETPAFYAYTVAFAFLAALSHPYEPLRAAPLEVQVIYWSLGLVGYTILYSLFHLMMLRLSLRFGVKTISETALMTITIFVLVLQSVAVFPILGIPVTDATQVFVFFAFCLVLFEVGAFGYLTWGDRALFPEIYAPEDEAPVDGRNYELFLRGTPLPVANVEIIRAMDKGIEVIGMNQTYTVKRSLQVTLSELPVHIGIQIHRTIWVSYNLARNYIDDGGTLYVTTSDGKRFPVARSRRAEFVAWVKMRA